MKIDGVIYAFFFLENQQHLLHCYRIREAFINNSYFQEVLTGTIEQQKKIAQIYTQILQTREVMLNPQVRTTAQGGGHSSQDATDKGKGY